MTRPDPRPGLLGPALAVLLAAAGLVPMAGGAQEPEPPRFMEGLSERCHPESWRTFNSRRIEDGDRITHIGMPDLRCPDGIRIQADSAVVHEAVGLSRFMGNVRYDSPERSLRSEEADYYEHTRRLFAEGDVEFTDLVRGIQLFGDQLDYLATYEHRPEERISARGERSRALLPPRGPDGTPDLDAEPWEVEGEHLQFEGERFFWADGDARLTRQGTEATAQSLTFDQEIAELVLERDARLRSEEYDLTGSRVVLMVPGDEIREARATGDALLVGSEYELAGDTLHVRPPDEEGMREVHSFGRARLDHRHMDMASDEIRIFLRGDQVERLTARRVPAGEEEERKEDADPDPEEEARDDEIPRDAARELAGALQEPDTIHEGAVQEQDRRARVTTAEFEMRADSVSILAPEQTLERLVGVGRARGETRDREAPEWEDAPEFLHQDFIEGDTVTAHFVPAEPSPEVVEVPDGDSVEGSAADSARGPGPPPGAGEGGQEPEYVLGSLEAIGDARSLYRLPPGVRSPAEEDPEGPGDEPEEDDPEETRDDAPPDGPSWGVSYVLANRIWIGMHDGEVDRMEARGEVDGLHLEPREAREEGDGEDEEEDDST